MRSIFAASVLGLAMIVGCSSDPYKAAQKTNNSLGSVKSELISDKGALNDAVEKLNNLVYSPQSDLRPQYEKYAASVDALEKSSAASRASARNMVSNRESYMSQWRADVAAMNDADLRMRALDRIKATEGEFSSLSTKLLDVDNSLSPLVNDLKSLKTYLAGDLTANGIKMVTDRATDAKNRAMTVNGKIDDAVMSLDKVSDEIAPMPATQPMGGAPTTMGSM